MWLRNWNGKKKLTMIHLLWVCPRSNCTLRTNAPSENSINEDLHKKKKPSNFYFLPQSVSTSFLFKKTHVLTKRKCANYILKFFDDSMPTIFNAWFSNILFSWNHPCWSDMGPNSLCGWSCTTTCQKPVSSLALASRLRLEEVWSSLVLKVIFILTK